ncbi:MAG: hypothetical protein ACREDR_09510 [Blastocatellia bacterium]
MIDFPESLAPWAPYLSCFPEEVGLAIGEMIRPMAAAVGPLRARRLAETGEPNGFNDLSRRGHYERLLASEWLLAEEAEDEFLRRAAMGEHLFLKTARREPSVSHASFALFDAGPNQLGSPRLAHIAALIVLARRAESGGAAFGWGVLQKPDMPALPAVATAEVRQLLESRTAQEATSAHLDGWRNRLADWTKLDDLWLVGGARLTRIPQESDSSMMLIRDTYDPIERSLSISIVPAHGSPRELSIELPSDQVCVRLLRDPFSEVVAEPETVLSKHAAQSNLLFDESGTKLFARSANGELIVYPVPNSPAAQPGKPRLYRGWNGESVHAAGKIGKSIALVTGDSSAVRLEYVGKRSDCSPAPGYHNPGVNKHLKYNPVTSRALRPCFRVPARGGPDATLLTLDESSSLFRLQGAGWRESPNSPASSNGTAHIVATGVLAIARVRSDIVYVGKELLGSRVTINRIGERPSVIPIPVENNLVSAHFGFGGSLTNDSYGFLAVGSNGNRYSIFTSAGMVEIGVPETASVRGVGRLYQANERKNEPILIALRRDLRTVIAIGSKTEVLFTASDVIRSIAVSVATPYVAYATLGGEVSVYSLIHRRTLCSFKPGDIE